MKLRRDTVVTFDELRVLRVENNSLYRRLKHAEQANKSLRAALAAATKEIEALRTKPWQEQIDGQSASISKLCGNTRGTRKDK